MPTMPKMYCNMQHSPSVRQSYSHAVMQSYSHTFIQCTAVSTHRSRLWAALMCGVTMCATTSRPMRGLPPPRDQWEAAQGAILTYHASPVSARRRRSYWRGDVGAAACSLMSHVRPSSQVDFRREMGTLAVSGERWRGEDTTVTAGGGICTALWKPVFYFSTWGKSWLMNSA